MTAKTRLAPAPLFDQYSVEQLADLTPYSESYLMALKHQPERITPRFRAFVSRILGKPEQALFGSAG